MPDIQNVWPIANPVTARAAAALPAAGAWDAAPTEIAIANTTQITFYITYTRGAAGGAFDFRLQGSPYSADLGGVQSWFTQSLYAAAALAAGADSQSRVQREYITYGSTGAGAETFVYGPIELGGTVERLRLPCRESGQVATPGTVHIVAVVV